MIGLKFATLFGLAVISALSVTVKAAAATSRSDKDKKHPGVRGLAVQGETVKICHIPPDDPSNFHTIMISTNAKAAHMAHGDLEGSCNENCMTLCPCLEAKASDCEEVCCPTCNPSETPSQNPTCNPPETPSQNPSEKPTESPSEKPSSSVPCSTVICQPGESCDPSDEQCKPGDQLVLCIAVIDKDDSFGSPNQATLWSSFRAMYPFRPFCLLVPVGGYTIVNVPSAFLADSNARVIYKVVRDNGNTGAAMDWYMMCGLNAYNGTGTVDWVGLFIDDYGSMRESQVAASRDLLYAKLASISISVQKVFNGNENWILPFMTMLVPV